MKYYERIIENEIRSKLTDESIIDIVGPRECGKTTVAEIFANSTLPLDEKIESYRTLSEFKPELLLRGTKPLLIDDIERLPILKDVIRRSSAKTKNNGLFITTNSRTPLVQVKMSPLTLYESGDSTGSVKILDLFKNPNIPLEGIESRLELEDLINVTCRGGFPDAMKNPQFTQQYIKKVLKNYLQEVNGVKRDYLKAQMILKTYALNTFTFEKNTELLRKTQKLCPTLAKSTLYSYLRDFKQMYFINEIPAWYVPIKCESSRKTVPLRAFCDPSIPAAILDLKPDDLLFDLEFFEKLFKNLCMRDLEVYTSIEGGKLYHYKDRYNVSVDCVLELSNRDYALINFNLSSKDIDESIKNLKNVEKAIIRNIQSEKLSINKPKFLAIITASHFAYTHKDGVKIIPVGVLG